VSSATWRGVAFATKSSVVSAPSNSGSGPVLRCCWAAADQVTEAHPLPSWLQETSSFSLHLPAPDVARDYGRQRRHDSQPQPTACPWPTARVCMVGDILRVVGPSRYCLALL
jgi:hypothetical protein